MLSLVQLKLISVQYFDDGVIHKCTSISADVQNI